MSNRQGRLLTVYDSRQWWRRIRGRLVKEELVFLHHPSCYKQLGSTPAQRDRVDRFFQRRAWSKLAATFGCFRWRMHGLLKQVYAQKSKAVRFVVLAKLDTRTAPIFPKVMVYVSDHRNWKKVRTEMKLEKVSTESLSIVKLWLVFSKFVWPLLSHTNSAKFVWPNRGHTNFWIRHVNFRDTNYNLTRFVGKNLCDPRVSNFGLKKPWDWGPHVCSEIWRYGVWISCPYRANFAWLSN